MTDPVDDREPVYQSTITARSRESLIELVRGLGIAVFEHTTRELPSKKGYAVDAFLTDPQIEHLREAGYEVKRGPNAHETGRARQAEVGAGNRYEDREQPLK